jgi:hypothetical protein
VGFVGLQFHAEPGELMRFAEDWAVRDSLVVVIERFFPEYVAERVEAGGVIAGARRLGGVDRVALGTVALDAGGSSAVEMMRRNPECLTLLVGRLTDAGLRESSITGYASDEASLRLWRRIVRRARSRMHRGASVYGVNTGALAGHPSHRHTPGAHALAERGVTMLALAGDNEYRFDDVRLSPPRS